MLAWTATAATCRCRDLEDLRRQHTLSLGSRNSDFSVVTIKVEPWMRPTPLLQFREKEGAMNAVKAKWKNGQVILEGHADWPEGSRLVVAQEAVADDEDGEDDPESIARWIAEADAIPPIEMTEQEEADWQAARQAQRALDIAKSIARADEFQRDLE
jgi:hypothetical protein